MQWTNEGQRWVKNSPSPLATFRLRCHNPDCHHEYEFSQNMRTVSQSNWLCRRCSADLFGHIDLITPSDQDIVDLAVNLFQSPSSNNKENVNNNNNNANTNKKPSPTNTVISVSSSDSPWKDGNSLFLAPGSYLTIQGLAEARRVGQAVFYITFPRKTSFKARMKVGLVHGTVLGQLRIVSLESDQRALQDIYRHVDRVDVRKTLLDLKELSMVSPSFPIYQVRRGGSYVEYRLSPVMLEWFAAYGGEYKYGGCVHDGFEGIFRKWERAQETEQGQIHLARVMQVLTFLHAHPCKRFQTTF